MLKEIWSSLGQPGELLSHVTTTGIGDLPSVYAVTDLAVASIGAATLSMAYLIAQRQDSLPDVQIDRVLASRWFSRSISPIGWELPPTWDAVAGDYETRDGWIKLHANGGRLRNRRVCIPRCRDSRGESRDCEATGGVGALCGCVHQLRF